MENYTARLISLVHMKRIFLISLFCNVSQPCNASLAFAEFDIFSGSSHIISGTLDAVPFTMSIHNTSSGFYFLGDGSVFNNSSSVFSDSNVFTPSSYNLDFLDIEKATNNPSDTLVTLSFAQPITDLTFLLNSFEDYQWDFSPTISSLMHFNGNSQFDVNGTIVRDITGSNANGTASGSFGLTGSYSSVSFNWERLDSDLDRMNFQLYGQQAVPVPAAIWLFGSGLIGLLGMLRKSKVHSIKEA